MLLKLAANYILSSPISSILKSQRSSKSLLDIKIERMVLAFAQIVAKSENHFFFSFYYTFFILSFQSFSLVIIHSITYPTLIMKLFSSKLIQY